VPDAAHPEDLRDFWFIFGEVGITGQTAFQVAGESFKRSAIALLLKSSSMYL
jgi:hypothetical protein